MSVMNTTKPVSIRRLQSRAAKSAIRRVNDIYNTERAVTELNKITDPSERKKRAILFQEEAETEVKRLAGLLTDLVPTDLSWDESESPLQIQQYLFTGSYLGSPKQKYKIPSIKTESPALRKLLNNYSEYTSSPKVAGESIEVDYLNPMGSHDFSSDDEFLLEWYRMNQGSKQDNIKNSDDGENVIETILA